MCVRGCATKQRKHDMFTWLGFFSSQTKWRFCPLMLSSDQFSKFSWFLGGMRALILSLYDPTFGISPTIYRAPQPRSAGKSQKCFPQKKKRKVKKYFIITNFLTFRTFCGPAGPGSRGPQTPLGIFFLKLVGVLGLCSCSGRTETKTTETLSSHTGLVSTLDLGVVMMPQSISYMQDKLNSEWFVF